MNPMAEQVGPDYFDATATAAALSPEEGEPLTVARVAAMRVEGALLGLPTAGEEWVFPTWQIVAGTVLPGLADVVGAFAGQPAWSIGLWLTTPHADFEGETPAAVLAAGGDVVRLVAEARATAERWS
jgi:hypothetical protein